MGITLICVCARDVAMAASRKSVCKTSRFRIVSRSAAFRKIHASHYRSCGYVVTPSLMCQRESSLKLDAVRRTANQDGEVTYIRAPVTFLYIIKRKSPAIENERHALGLTRRQTYSCKPLQLFDRPLYAGMI